MIYGCGSMYGAIIGDLAGSIYEYSQTKEIKSIQVNEIIEEKAFFSDDTILTIAIADAILHDRDYDKYLREYIKKYRMYKPDFEPYFKNAFSPSLIKWSTGNYVGTSIGNGAMMRISPIGFMFDNEKDIIENARLATIPSHNSEEAIGSATTIALLIYYLRIGGSKEDIFQKMNLAVKYVPFCKFNTTCSETLGNCLYAFYASDSFEDAIRKALLMGGDTDTNCAIVGSLAEAYYGIDNHLKEQVNEKIPKEFVKILSKKKN